MVPSQLDEEIESWKGFPWALRKDDLDLWNTMVNEVKERFGEAVEQSGKELTTDTFFMSLLLAQQRTIKLLQAQLGAMNGRKQTLDEFVAQSAPAGTESDSASSSSSTFNIG